MIAEYAGRLVAKFIDKQWPNDKAQVYEILRLGINKAWQEGKWLGMTAEFFVPIYRDLVDQAYIMTPQSHPILLAVNAQAMGTSIRDPYFMFHKNGYGDVRNHPGCTWNRDVYDVGQTPIFNKNNINICEGVRLGVRVIGSAGPNEKVWINGLYSDENRIFTYKNKSAGQPCACCIDTSTVDRINGIELAVNSNFNYISNISFNSIISITKTLTRSPVEIIAIDQCNNAYPIARMLPNQRFSNYRKYLVPNDMCSCQCLHVLCKIAQQEEITCGTDSIMISNDEALISLAKGIHNMYYIEQQEKGANYILQGIAVLEKEKREEESPDVFPIQVEGISDNDLATALKYYH